MDGRTVKLMVGWSKMDGRMVGWSSVAVGGGWSDGRMVECRSRNGWSDGRMVECRN